MSIKSIAISFVYWMLSLAAFGAMCLWITVGGFVIWSELHRPARLYNEFIGLGCVFIIGGLIMGSYIFKILILGFDGKARRRRRASSQPEKGE